MEAKRKALESVVTNRADTTTDRSPDEDRSGSTAITQHFEGVYPQKSPQSDGLASHRGVYNARKSKKIIGSSGRTRTYNPSVNRALIRRGNRMFSTE